MEAAAAGKPKKQPKPPMTLPWRGREYKYKNGIVKWHPDKAGDTESGIICGADTESTTRGATGNKAMDRELPEIYETQCLTYATPNGSGIVWVPEGVCAFPLMLNSFIKEMRIGGVDHKRKWFVYMHNLGYDVEQLFKGRADLMTLVRGGSYLHAKLPIELQGRKKSGRDISEYYVGKIGNRECYLKNRALFVGTAPHFTVRCYRNRKDYSDIVFLDSGTYFRGTLANIAKDLKLPYEKQERQKDLGRHDFRLEDGTEEKRYFETYSIADAVVVKAVGEKIVELHREAGFTKIRTSSPGFAHAFFCKELEKLKTVVYSGSLLEEDMKLILDAYNGGRTGGLYHGRVGHLGPESLISVGDFASSYPASMLGLPSFGPKMKYVRLRPRELDWFNVWDLLQDCPTCFLRIDGVENDSNYPSLITERGGKLTPIYGEFENIATTGPEVYGGVMSGTLRVTKVREAVFCIDKALVESPFRRFALDAYERKKKAEKGSISYILAKLLLNSAYGKWIQATKAQLLGTDADDFVCYYPKGCEHDYAKIYMETYAKAQYEGEDALSVLEDLRVDIMEGCAEEGLELESKLFARMDTAKKEFAPSAIPAAAALVTAISRARLRALIKCTGAIYWDTDSAFIQGKSNEEIEACFATGSAWIHPAFVPLRMGSELGEIDIEMEGGSGYLAGTKRYYLTSPSSEKAKKAIHGIINLKGRYAGVIIRALATGKQIEYKTKGAPLKAKSTTDARTGLFTRKQVTPNFQLDDRLSWIRDDGVDAWRGSVREWREQA